MNRAAYFLSIFIANSLFATNTELKLYRPFTNEGPVIPHVIKRVNGACKSQSELILREDAWKCEAEGHTFDPCFVKAGPNRTQAICPHSPWAADSIEINTVNSLDNSNYKTLDMSRTYPWAVELEEGIQCLAYQSERQFDNMPIRYRCGNQTYLIGHLQRCANPWSIMQKTKEGIASTRIKQAWF